MHKAFHFKSHYQWLKALYLKYERLLMPATLIVGFIVDYITFTTIQIDITLLLLLAYWIIAALSIVFIHLYDAGKLSQKLKYARLFLPLLIQFTFGALLGGTFIFYWFSGSFWASWPFILIMVLLMISNDVFRNHFQKPVVQISVHFFISLSLFSIVLPYVFNSLSERLFLGAGALSVIFTYLFIRFLAAFSEPVRKARPRLSASIFAILLSMNFLYFANVIPPIPLSLRESGVYHSVQRIGTSYRFLEEPASLFQIFSSNQKLHLAPGERAFVYSAVFAPADLNTTILHRWQRYDDQKNVWVTTDKQAFQITGGRKQGYRGFSWKTDPTPGAWRVYIETESGKVLGRVKFQVEKVRMPVMLEEVIR